jgi:hypothetical protein
MTNRFLISVAAVALIAGTGFANAQGMSREGGAAGGAATQQSAPSSERAAPSGAMNHDSAGTKGSDTSGMKAESNEKMPSAKSAQDTKSDTKGGKDMKAEGRDSKSGNTAAEGRDRDSKSGTTAAEGRDKSGNMNAQTKGTTDSKSTATTGNAATSATAAPPAEKRTQIVSAIKSERIEETTNVNFNIAVGATIPGTVRFHPLPARIVEIYPEWRGYDVVFVQGRYIIVRPRTHEIVYIIEG